MSKKKYPPLTSNQIIKILETLDFSFARQKGSHRHYKNQEGKLATVPMRRGDVDKDIIKSIIKQTGKSRKEFYGAIKTSAKKL